MSGKGRTTIEHSEIMSELYAKVVFSNKMSELNKSDLKKHWKEFSEQVNKAIENIEGVPFR
jgi:hypothetical protein